MLVTFQTFIFNHTCARIYIEVWRTLTHLCAGLHDSVLVCFFFFFFSSFFSLWDQWMFWKEGIQLRKEKKGDLKIVYKLTDSTSLNLLWLKIWNPCIFCVSVCVFLPYMLTEVISSKQLWHWFYCSNMREYTDNAITFF